MYTNSTANNQTRISNKVENTFVTYADLTLTTQLTVRCLARADPREFAPSRRVATKAAILKKLYRFRAAVETSENF